MTQRYQRFLRQRYGIVLRYTGLILLISGSVLLLPLLALPAYPEEWPLVWGFLLPGGLSSVVGYWLWRQPTADAAALLTRQEGAVIVVLGWLMAIALSTVPYLTIGQLPLTHACFEATSGWTTTGLSLMEVHQAPHVILLLRSLTQLFGGAGFTIIAVGAISPPSGARVIAAEGRGEQLVPNLRHSAKLVLAIYSGYVAFGIGGLRLAGMGWFDALNHSFTALSTGGFSTQVNSIGEWHQPAIELIVLVLMMCGSVYFLTVYLLLQHRFRFFWRNSELRLQLGLILIGVGLLWTVTHTLYSPMGRSLRIAVFETVAALSTTGFTTVSYDTWSGFGWWLLMCLMLVGGGAGSTAGGVKLYRIMVILKGLVWGIHRQCLPPNTIREPVIWQGNRRQFLDLEDMYQASLFLVIYLFVLTIGTGVLTAYGYSLQDSLFEFISSLSTVGLSVGITSSDAPAGVLWTEIVGMVLGRLEFLTVAIASLRLIQDGRNLIFQLVDAD